MLIYSICTQYLVGAPFALISEVKWHTTKYGDPYSEFVLCIWPIQSAHTQQWTHTHREHTHTVNTHPEQWARGAVGGSVPCSRAPQSWYWGWRESAGYSLPPPTIPAGPFTTYFTTLQHVILIKWGPLYVRVLSCASCVPASCFHIWFVSGLY